MPSNTLPFQYLKRANTFEDLHGAMRTEILEARDREVEDYLGKLYDLANRAFILASNAISQAAGDARYVNVTGDSMTGDLTIAANNLLMGSALRQMINLWGASYGLGVQTNHLYMRSPASFAWFKAGSHSDTAQDPGAGGTMLMRLDNAGQLLFPVGNILMGPAKSAASTVATLGLELQGQTGVIAGTVNTANNINLWLNKIGGANLANEVYARFSIALGPTTAGEIKLVAGPGVTYGTTSDRRMKRLIALVEGATERVQRLKVWHFAWKSDDTQQDGFVADEVAEIVPDAVTGERDAVDRDGQPVLQQLDQSRLVPILTAALQEALARIGALEQRVQALEAA